jgi:hypothetical protein
MTGHRFVLNDQGEVIDQLNPNGPKGYCHDGGREDAVYLRMRVLMVRLGKLVRDLIVQPELPGQKYEAHNSQEHDLWHTLCAVITASRLNALGTESLKKEIERSHKDGLQAFTSLSLFCDDVERLLRDLYGDVESDALDALLRAVFVVAETFVRYVRKDLWQEHQDALDWDYIWGIGNPEGYGFSGSDHRRAMRAIDDLQLRARHVSDNPSAFSRYTLEFVKIIGEKFKAHDDGRNTCNDEVDEVPF